MSMLNKYLYLTLITASVCVAGHSGDTVLANAAGYSSNSSLSEATPIPGLATQLSDLLFEQIVVSGIVGSFWHPLQKVQEGLGNITNYSGTDKDFWLMTFNPDHANALRAGLEVISKSCCPLSCCGYGGLDIVLEELTDGMKCVSSASRHFYKQMQKISNDPGFDEDEGWRTSLSTFRRLMVDKAEFAKSSISTSNLKKMSKIRLLQTLMDIVGDNSSDLVGVQSQISEKLSQISEKH
ncbi:MAG: hypothetical protein LBQ43_01270 [Holosporales bacterium]|nr:hypothetical protein [Holosporales bacterium]